MGLQNIFQEEKDQFYNKAYPEYTERIKILKTLREIIVNNQTAFIKAINQDFGCRPAHETQVLEIFICLESIDYAIKNLKKWLKSESHKTSKWFWPSKSFTVSIPVGLVGIISPWNYPLFLSIIPLVGALAAGNRVMIKTSELAPNFSELLKNLLDPKIARVILGGAEVGQEFAQLEFDHLLFTGSTSIGKKIMQAASKNLTRLTLELGGKSPAIICPNELTSEYVNNIWLGKIINAGQTCVAPDHVYVPKGLSNIFLAYSKDCHQINNLNIASEHYCSIVNQVNYKRIIDLVHDAIEKGAIWHPLKLWNDKWFNENNNIYKIAPGLLFNINSTMDIMHQEIFGPVMPIIEYDNIDDIITSLSSGARPLAVYLFTKDLSVYNKFLYKTHSGALSVNATMVHLAQESLPFGGVGHSGFGCYRGKNGFDSFSYKKPVYKQSVLNIFNKFYPPNPPISWLKKIIFKLIIK